MRGIALAAASAGRTQIASKKMEGNRANIVRCLVSWAVCSSEFGLRSTEEFLSILLNLLYRRLGFGLRNTKNGSSNFSS